MSFAARHNQAKTVGQVIGDAVWKRSGISATMGSIQKFRPLILGLPVGIPNKNKKGKKAWLGLHGCLQFPNPMIFITRFML